MEEEIELVPYDPGWPRLFEQERALAREHRAEGEAYTEGRTRFIAQALG